MSAPTLRVRNLTLRYRKGPVVLELQDAAVPPGELVAMIGPNGGGKTTLLRTMAGLMPPRGGEVLLNRRPLYGSDALSRRERSREIAVVLTGTLAPGYLRVEELVDLGRIPYHGFFSRGESRSGEQGRIDARAVREAMETVGVDHLAHRRVGSLSDGERQRALIARALAQEPHIMLLDEPAAHLDPPHQTQLFLLLNRLISEGVIASALVATHNIHLALHFATTLFIVADGGVTIGDPCSLLDGGELDRAFLNRTPDGTTSRSHPEVELDRTKGWFIPRRHSVPFPYQNPRRLF
ncbi:MAG: ABC transporter ATP-binding protein [Alkalispirochaetaceae bacterium]